MSEGTILIVDDERLQREILYTTFKELGYDVEMAKSGKEALKLHKDSPKDLVLLDLRLQDVDGMTLIKGLLRENSLSVIIIMTAYGSIDSAVEAMRLGVFDYLTKPIERDKLLIAVKRGMEKVKLVKENIRLHEELEDKFRIENFIGSHGKLKEVVRIIKKVAAGNSTVLIYGESGTGKELVARALHYNSSRKNKPFSAINCAALPDTLLESELFGYEKGSFTGAISRKIGLFEDSDKGTLFLDEIGDLSFSMQAKILRVLQEREIRRLGGRENIKIDVRIIAATNKDLDEEMRNGNFRRDLYYRLNVVPIFLPPLRERITDIPELVEHFIKKFNILLKKEAKGISKEALELLMRYHWPGNVRQLESVIERSLNLAEQDFIESKDLPPEILKVSFSLIGGYDLEIPEGGLSFDALEKELIVEAIKKANGVVMKAAKLLGMSYYTFSYRMKKFGLKKELFP